MPSSLYTQNDTRRLRVVCTDPDTGLAIDPATVTFLLRAPGEATTSVTYAGGGVARDAQGDYHVDVQWTAPGTWGYGWQTTSPPGYAERRVMVAASAL